MGFREVWLLLCAHWLGALFALTLAVLGYFFVDGISRRFNARIAAKKALREEEIYPQKVRELIAVTDRGSAPQKSFFLSPKEIKDMGLWLGEHDKTCRHAKGSATGAVGGRLSFVFTPTGIGCIIEIQCVCGAREDVTDYSLW